ncbi:MAG: signal recognition particle-docking protein FtsY [Candidatus Diapherotrites archaeon]|nr:signal recognition particle-docking protein FtsY [Candidatus Diapherotrites archaeon]
MFDVLKQKLNDFSKKLKTTLSREPESFPQESKPALPESKLISSEEPKRVLKAEISAISKVKHVFSSKVKLSEKDLEDLLFDLELSLLEADVAHSTSQAICSSIKEKLLSMEFDKSNLDSAIQKEIRSVLISSISIPSFSLFDKVKQSSKKPFTILLLGPNGAGKTTTIAKLSHYFLEHNLKIVLAAADTFRAASIEQLAEHAQRLKVRMIAHTYGSDPAAVAFDAVRSAEAGHIDVVLIDSAGRQETNTNLMQELKKMVRVVKPDLKIFIGESLAGHALLDQALEYHEQLSLDGFILTKLDTDTKGGTIISLLHEIKKPVLFLGIGQKYSDLIEFNLDYILEKII